MFLNVCVHNYYLNGWYRITRAYYDDIYYVIGNYTHIE